MRLTYFGKGEQCKYRVAVLSFREKEEAKANAVMAHLEENGYTCGSGVGEDDRIDICIRVDDPADFAFLKRCYKESK